MLLINHSAGQVLKFVLTEGQFCICLLQKHETVPFTRVNVEALPLIHIKVFFFSHLHFQNIYVTVLTF